MDKMSLADLVSTKTPETFNDSRFWKSIVYLVISYYLKMFPSTLWEKQRGGEGMKERGRKEGGRGGRRGGAGSWREGGLQRGDGRYLALGHVGERVRGFL